MKIRFIKPSFEIDMQGETGIEKLKRIEKIGRLCYKSEDKITEDSYERFIKMLIKNDHTAMIEHAEFSVKFITSRAFTHEMVRHRICSFAQESQRYVGYGNVIEFVIPSWSNLREQEIDTSRWGTFREYMDFEDPYMPRTDAIWIRSMWDSASYYSTLLMAGWKPEQARDVLNNAAKTEIWVTTNLREWRNIFALRDHHTASPQMRELMEPLHIKISGMFPGVFL